MSPLSSAQVNVRFGEFDIDPRSGELRKRGIRTKLQGQPFQVLQILLEHAGFEVRTALIGTRGEELFKAWRPDAVITDMILPDVDGIELVRKLRQALGDEAEKPVL